MKVLYFSPVPSEGMSLPTASTLRDALGHFTSIKLFDASVTYGIDSWDEFLANHSMMANAFDVVLLGVPHMKKADRPAFYRALKRYTASPLAKPVVGYFSDIDPQTSFNLVTAGVAIAHRTCEHVGTLATYLGRAATHAIPAADAPPPYQMGPVTIDYAQKRAFVASAPVKLTGDQFDLLSYLSRRHGRPCTKEMLLDAMDKGEDIQDKLADVVVCKIRQALSAAHPDHPDAGDRTLRTMWGRGYYVVATKTDYDAPLPAKKTASVTTLPAPAKARIA